MKSDAKPWIVRQGDCLLMKIEPPAKGTLKPAPKDPRGVVLAEGDSSQHHHQVFGGKPKLMLGEKSTRVLIVGEGAELRVVGGGSDAAPRHVPIALPAGAFEVRTQRQWTAADERASDVQD